MKLWPTDRLPNHIDGEEEPILEPYLISSRQDTIAVIIFPGGGYGMRAAHEGEPVARWLNSIGLSAFVCHYRVAPHRYPTPLLDAKRAIRTVRAGSKEWGIDPDKIGVLGFSAGGHLAALSGVQFDPGINESEDPVENMPSNPNFMILCYPVISMQGPYAHFGSQMNLLGGNPTADMLEKVSPDEHVTSRTPPAFLWHTADDASVQVENVFLLSSALKKQGVPFELHVFPEGRHGLGLAKGEGAVEQWTSLCEKWLKDIIK